MRAICAVSSLSVAGTLTVPRPLASSLAESMSISHTRVNVTLRVTPIRTLLSRAVSVVYGASRDLKC